MKHDTDTRDQLIDLLDDFRTGMLVTRALNGDLRSRPMQLARADDDGTLYFAASSKSAKVDELAAQPEVNVVFQDGGKYLSLSGHADLLDDPELVDELYAPDWKVWFPEGKQDPELRILRVDAKRGEYWDVSGSGRIRFMYEAGKALIRGEEMDDFGKDHHAKVEL